jgi:hypothetical protein
MDKHKLILPISIVLGCIVLGSFYYIVQLNKQQYFGKQEQIDAQQKQSEFKVKAETDQIKIGQEQPNITDVPVGTAINQQQINKAASPTPAEDPSIKIEKCKTTANEKAQNDVTVYIGTLFLNASKKCQELYPPPEGVPMTCISQYLPAGIDYTELLNTVRSESYNKYYLNCLNGQ